MVNRLFVSFSGGETSGFMSLWARDQLADGYDEVLYVFANTGQENEETLRFVDQCDKFFGLGVVWIEADIDPNNRRAGGFRVVDFETASRNGEPFEKAIQAYGIPNQAWPHCTRELKTRPMTAYLRSIGWASKTYDTAIGIRSDEIDRVDPKATGKNFLYPLIDDYPMTKPEINAFWQSQPFRLQLKGYQGNCKTCWKKTDNKLLQIMRESPEAFDFNDRMEKQYGHIGPLNEQRVFFRKNHSTESLRARCIEGEGGPVTDDADIEGCGESCDVDFSEVQ